MHVDANGTNGRIGKIFKESKKKKRKDKDGNDDKGNEVKIKIFSLTERTQNWCKQYPYNFSSKFETAG